MVVVMPPVARATAARSGAKEAAKAERFDIGIPNLMKMDEPSTHQVEKQQYWRRSWQMGYNR
jgi:hypothetical protein